MSSRRWIMIGVAVAAALGLVALLLTRDGGDDDVTASRDTSTTAMASSTTTTTTVGTATTVLPGAAPAASTTTRRGVAAGPTATTTGARPCSQPAAGSAFSGFGAAEIVINSAGQSRRSCVLTAGTEAQQRQGLMNQDDLDGYDGMLFRFAGEAVRNFWMRNTRIPLSIAFFATSGAFVSATDMAPCGDSPDCPNYSSGGPAKYALEVVQGQLPGVGAIAGSQLVV